MDDKNELIEIDTVINISSEVGLKWADLRCLKCGEILEVEVLTGVKVKITDYIQDKLKRGEKVISIRFRCPKCGYKPPISTKLFRLNKEVDI